MPTIVFVILFILLGSYAWGAVLAAPWVPTLQAQRNLLIAHLRLEESSPLTIYDLGCGSGSILFAFADRYPDARCIGYDVALLPLLFGWIRKLRSPKKYKNVSLRFGNFFTKHFNDADVIVAFLMQGIYEKFCTVLHRELRPGTLVAVEAWPLPNREYIQKIEGTHLTPWYVYRWK